MRKRLSLVVAAALLVSSGCAPVDAQSRPALLVLVTVDQLPSRYIARFDAQLTGGFRRLLDDGTYYVTALHDHAMTMTAPGHATLWSGRFPAHTNIISNDLGVPDPSYPLIGGLKGAGASPRRFRGSTLVDWMIRADSATRVLSVSKKDRGAIMPVGSARAPVYWWSSDGGFTTSTYYADTLPGWVQTWNARVRTTDWSSREWQLLLDKRAYPEKDSLEFEGVSQKRGYAFPHRPPSIREMERFPWMDSLTLDLALHGVRTLGLGRRDGTDVLAISLSVLDLVGHDFGPDSREVHDQFLRLDRYLGDFLTALERELPGRGIVLALSSDHGIMSMPEYLAVIGKPSGRISLSPALRDVIAPLQRRYRTDFAVLAQQGIVLADTVAMRARGIDVRRLATDLAAAVGRLPGVAHVFTPASLTAAPPDDPAAGRWRRSIPPDYAWLVAAEPKEDWVIGTEVKADHGTPLRNNMEVPVFLYGSGIARQRVTRVIRTVDVAPTLAALLRITPTERPDGVVLREVVKTP